MTSQKEWVKIEVKLRDVDPSQAPDLCLDLMLCLHKLGIPKENVDVSWIWGTWPAEKRPAEAAAKRRRDTGYPG